MRFVLNDPKTFAVVYKGTNVIVSYGKKPQYFRTSKVAENFIPILEGLVFEDLEVVKVKEPLQERILLETKKDNEKAKNIKVKESRYLNYLKENQEEYGYMLEQRKEGKRNKIRDYKEEDYF